MTYNRKNALVNDTLRLKISRPLWETVHTDRCGVPDAMAIRGVREPVLLIKGRLVHKYNC